MSFRELATQVQARLGEMLVHGRVPLELILRSLGGGIGQAPQFPVWCQFVGSTACADLPMEGLSFRGLRVERMAMQNEVEFDMFETLAGLDCNLEHRAALFESDAMARQGQRLSAAFRLACSDPESTLAVFLDRLQASTKES
jgi:hypothetical protein